MAFDALWEKTFAPALAPTCERGASAFSAHACAKSMLAFTRAFGRLKSAFHNTGCARDARRATLESWEGLSIEAHRQIRIRITIASASGF